MPAPMRAGILLFVMTCLLLVSFSGPSVRPPASSLLHRLCQPPPDRKSRGCGAGASGFPDAAPGRPTRHVRRPVLTSGREPLQTAPLERRRLPVLQGRRAREAGPEREPRGFSRRAQGARARAARAPALEPLPRAARRGRARRGGAPRGAGPRTGVVLTPGSNLLVLALARPRAPSSTPSRRSPTTRAARRRRGRRGGAPPRRRVRAPIAALLAAMDGDGGVLFLPNPHAPTGKLFEQGDVAELAARAKARGWLLVVDEAYHAFAGTDARPLARANGNVAVLRTFSKSWALGGIRAGYLLGSPEVATVVRACVPPFCIPAHTSAILSDRPRVARLCEGARRAHPRRARPAPRGARGPPPVEAVPERRELPPRPDAGREGRLRPPPLTRAGRAPAGSLHRPRGLHPDHGRHPGGERSPARGGGRGALTSTAGAAEPRRRPGPARAPGRTVPGKDRHAPLPRSRSSWPPPRPRSPPRPRAWT